MQEKQNAATSKADKCESRDKELHKTLDQFYAQVEAMYEKIGADPEPIEELLGTEHVDMGNVMIYLGIIEERTDQLLQANYRIQKKVGHFYYMFLLINQSDQIHMCCIWQMYQVAVVLCSWVHK